MYHIRIKLEMFGYWISQISGAHLQYPLWKQEAESWESIGNGETPARTCMTSPALITVLLGTWVCVAINYPAELEQVTGLLLHSQPRAAISLSNCTRLAVNLYLGELFFSNKNSLLLPSHFQGKSGTSTPRRGEQQCCQTGTYKDTTKAWLLVKLPPVGETRHFLRYPQYRKARFVQNITACKITGFVRGASLLHFNGTTFLDV